MTDRDRTARVQRLRSSGAAGPHGHQPTRADQLADALADELDDEVHRGREMCLCGTGDVCLAHPADNDPCDDAPHVDDNDLESP